MATVNNYTSTGKAYPFSKGSGPLANLGREINGKVYQHPRQKDQIAGGASVVVTNPKASTLAGRNSRTASLGMGGVGQRGRNRDY